MRIKFLRLPTMMAKARNFTLEDYFCGKLKRAFADIDDCQETVPEARKVRVFMQGLRSPELQVARSQVIASERYSTNVEDAMNYVKSYENSLDSMKTTTKNVSSFETSGRGRGRGNGRGGGRGSGRGGHGGRGGDNDRGRNKGRGGQKKTDYMPREKRNSLSAEEQQAIRNAQDKAGIGTKCKVASMETDKQESKKAKTEDTTGVGDNMTRQSIKKRE
jgi:hypothetical protein